MTKNLGAVDGDEVIAAIYAATESDGRERIGDKDFIDFEGIKRILVSCRLPIQPMSKKEIEDMREKAKAWEIVIRDYDIVDNPEAYVIVNDEHVLAQARAELAQEGEEKK